MPEELLIYLGTCIRKARTDLGLTQEKLSEQTGVSLRHIANIEKGRMNPSYEILRLLIRRLGVSTEILFYPDCSEQDAELLKLVGKYNACSDEDRQILLRTLNCLSDELMRRSSLSETRSKEKADMTR